MKLQIKINVYLIDIQFIKYFIKNILQKSACVFKK